MTYISLSIGFAFYHCHRLKLFLYVKKWHRPGVFVPLQALGALALVGISEIQCGNQEAQLTSSKIIMFYCLDLDFQEWIFGDNQVLLEGGNITEPWHVKTNNVAVCPAKPQISLGICPVWSEISLSAFRNLGSLATHWAHSEDSDQTGGCPGWSESLLGTHSCCWFCHVVALIIFLTMSSTKYFVNCAAKKLKIG